MMQYKLLISSGYLEVLSGLSIITAIISEKIFFLAIYYVAYYAVKFRADKSIVHVQQQIELLEI